MLFIFMSAKTSYIRKHRHRANNKLREIRSVRPHKEPRGRTGSIQKKKNPSSQCAGGKWVIPNSPIIHILNFEVAHSHG